MMDKFELFINFCEAQDPIDPIIPGGQTSPEFIDASFNSLTNGAPTGDFTTFGIFLFLFIFVIAVFGIFKIVKKGISNNPLEPSNDVLHLLLNKKIIASIFSILAAISICSFAVANASSYNSINTTSINAYVHNDGTIDFEAGILTIPDEYGLKFDTLTASYCTDIYDANTTWTIDFNNTNVYNNKIPGKSSVDDLIFRSKIYVNMSVDRVDPEIAKSLIGNTVVKLDVDMQEIAIAKFNLEPTLVPDFSFNNKLHPLLNDLGTSQFGEIYYYLSDQNKKPHIDDSGWTDNWRDIMAKNVGEYYIWSYIKAFPGYLDSDIFDIGCVKISKAQRTFALQNESEKNITLIPNQTDYREIAFKIDDFGGSQDQITISPDVEDNLDVEIDFYNSIINIRPQKDISEVVVNPVFTLKDINKQYNDSQLSMSIKISDTAGFIETPELHESLNFKNSDLLLLKKNGSTNNGQIYYFLSTDSIKPDKSDAGWTDNPDEICAKDIGTYYVWTYIQGENGLKDSDIIDLGSTSIIKGERKFFLENEEDINIYLTPLQTDPTEVMYKIEDDGGSDNKIVVELSNDDVADVSIDLENSKFDISPKDDSLDKSCIATFTLTDKNNFYNDCKIQINITVTTAAQFTTIPKLVNNFEFDGDSHQLVDKDNPGKAKFGEIYYKITQENTKPKKNEQGWENDASLITGAYVDTYYVWAYVKAEQNYTDSEIISLGSVNIKKGTRIISVDEGNDHIYLYKNQANPEVVKFYVNKSRDSYDQIIVEPTINDIVDVDVDLINCEFSFKPKINVSNESITLSFTLKDTSLQYDDCQVKITVDVSSSAIFVDEPVIVKGFSYDFKTHKFIDNAGTSKFGTIYYYMSNNRETPSTDQTGWNSNPDSFCGKDINKYYLWSYVKGEDGYVDSSILYLGYVEIFQAERQFSVAKEDKIITLFPNDNKPTYINFNIKDDAQGGNDDTIDVSTDIDNCINIEASLSDKQFMFKPKQDIFGKKITVEFTLHDNNGIYKDCSLSILVDIGNEYYELYEDPSDNETYAMLVKSYYDKVQDKLDVPNDVMFKYGGDFPTQSCMVKKIGNGTDGVFTDDDNGVIKININSNITTIDAYAFKDNNVIQSISGSFSNFTNIGKYAFENCAQFNSFNKTESYAFVGPYSLLNIGDCAFKGCFGGNSLSLDNDNECNVSLDLPINKLSIGKQSFYNTCITSVVFKPDLSLTNIGYQAFVNTKINPTSSNGIKLDVTNRYILDAANLNMSEFPKNILCISDKSDNPLRFVRVIASGAFADNSNEKGEPIEYINKIVIDKDADNKLYVNDRAFSNLQHILTYLVKRGQIEYGDNPFQFSFTGLLDSQRPIFAGTVLPPDERNLPDESVIKKIRSNAIFLGYKEITGSDLTSVHFYEDTYYYLNSSSQEVFADYLAIRNNSPNCFFAVDLNSHTLSCGNFPESNSIVDKFYDYDNPSNIIILNSGSKNSTIKAKNEADTPRFFVSWANSSLTLIDVTVKDWSKNGFADVSTEGAQISFYNSTISGCTDLKDTSYVELNNQDATLFMDNVSVSKLSACPGAAFASGNGKIECSNSTFSECKNDGNLSTSRNYFGGVFNLNMYYDSIFKNCNFSKNFADDRGGVFYVEKHNSQTDPPSLTFTECNFGNINDSSTGNYADDGKGGAIYADGIELDIQSSVFAYCKADDDSYGDGGAVYSTGCILDIKGSTFQKCLADESGGAIYTTNSPKIVIENSNFEDNISDDYKGGAIYAESVSGFDINGKCNFKNNVTESNNHGDGGAIYCKNSSLSIVGESDSDNFPSFKSNRADYAGGAICYIDAANSGHKLTIKNVDFTSSDTVVENPKGNQSNGKGGAIYCQGEIDADHVKFLYNISANSSGVREADGGAVYLNSENWDNSESKFSNCTFKNNNVDDYGGALCANTVCSLNIENCTFGYNQSENCGGAIWARHINAFTITGNRFATFYNNHTTSDGDGEGGCLYVRDSTLNINGDYDSGLSFDSNYAKYDDGGAIFAANCITTISYVKFYNNYSENCGGALNIDGGSLTIQDQTRFESNYTKKDEGGAIYSTNMSSNCFIICSSSKDNFIYFYNNEAKSDDGGAIYADSDLYIKNVEFDSNKCENQGGAIKISHDTADFKIEGYCKFDNNHSKKDQGGAIYAYCFSAIINCDKDSESCFTDNKSKNDNGGAVYLRRPGPSTGDYEIRNVNFEHNYASGSSHYGGAIYYWPENSYYLYLYNVQLHDNEHEGKTQDNSALAVYSWSSTTYFILDEHCGGQTQVYID